MAADDPLIEAMRFLEEASRNGKPLTAYREQDIPLRWVPEKMRRYLYERDEGGRKLLADRYEFLLYRQLRNGVEAGDVFCANSCLLYTSKRLACHLAGVRLLTLFIDHTDGRAPQSDI